MPLRHKINGHAVFSTVHDEKRFDALSKKLAERDFAFEPYDLLKTVDWASRKVAFRGSAYEPAHDVIDVATRMVDLGGADTATVMASILYPALQPDKTGTINESDFGEVKGLFGEKVHDIVCATLAFSQIEYRPLRINQKNNKPRDHDTEEQKKKPVDVEALRKRHMRDFRYMALFASSKYVKEMPNAILIRGTNYLFDVENIKKVRDQASKDELLVKIKDLYADIVSIAGYRNVQEALMNEWLRFKEPKIYTQIQEERNKHIGVGHSKKLQMQNVVTSDIAKAMDGAGFVHGNYAIETHLKTPWSIYKKMREKNIRIEDLHVHIKDFVQARIIIDVERYQEMQGSPRHPETEYGLCAKAHRALDGRFGPVLGPYKDPTNPRLFVLNDGTVSENIDLVADKDRIQWVSRFKDYMKHPNKAEQRKIENRIWTPVLGPKRNGYSAMHDGFRIADGDVEVQIVSKERHHLHLYGVSAHGGFKAADYKSESVADAPLLAWYRAVRGQVSRAADKLADYYIGAYAGDNRIVIRPGPMNVVEFARGISEDKAISCIGALQLTGGGPYGAEGNDTFPPAAQRDTNGFFPLDAEVHPGMNVQLLLAQGAHRSISTHNRQQKALRRPNDRRRVLRYIEQLDKA